MKPLIRYFILFFVTLPVTGYAQPPEVTYLGNVAKSGYVNNAAYGPFDIGFDFTFFGNTYNQFYVSSNGLVTFGSGSTDSTEDPVPDPAAPNNFIAAFWDDLAINPYGNILYATIGASPTRKLVVQFRNMAFYTTPPYMGTFSVILHETTNLIKVQFRTVILPENERATGGDATIGIENIDGTAGVQYIYHNPWSVSSWKAISFTPSGPTYILDTDAVYDGVYLTTNTTLPEPGIFELVSPPPASITGTEILFEWTPSTNATSYALLLGTNPILVGSTTYSPISSTSYNLSGLIPDTTYYWTVFAINSTGYTWSEVKRFRTSSTPPLLAVPREVWVAQGDERLGYLQYTGGDAGPKTATVTTLPSQGELWQVSGGMKSTRITSVPAIVTDPQYALIYVASGGTGNGAGSFNFRFTDGTGDSPEATITINVNPPGIPNLLNTARNEGVELRFDRVMNNPAGKESQFTVTVDGSPVAVTSAGLKTGDPYTITLTLASPLTGSENVSVSYTKGDVSAITGGLLESFTDQTVTLLAQTISFTTNLDKVYGNSPFSLSATSSSGLTTFTWSSSNLTVATISGSTVTILSAGISEISALQAGNAIYAPARYIRTLTVSKANQTITFNPLADKTYGDSPFSLTATASSGLPVSYSSDNPAVASVTGNTVTINGAGTAVITASQSGNSNWNPAPDVQRTLTVSRANQTITFDPLPAKTFGDAPFTISASATSGLAVSFTSDNPAVASVSGNTVTINGAGTANITASQAGNANYNAAPDVQQTLSVSKANQTIIFNPLPDKTYGDEPFALEAFVNSGLPVTYSSGNTQVATITGFTVTITGAGTSVITASQPGNANYYAADDVQQTLTVNKAPQVITVTRKPENLLVSDTFHLRALSTSGLEVQYESSNTAVVSVSGNVITGVSKGTVTVRALNSGNSNYLAAPDVTFTVTVTSSHPNILYLFTPNGDGFNDYWELPLNLWGRCEVKIYNRWGKLVYDNPDYNNLWDGTSDGNPVPEGAYYFVVKTESAGTVKGTVNIVR